VGQQKERERALITKEEHCCCSTFLRANLTRTLTPVVQSKVRLRDQHIERDSYLIYHIFSYCPQYSLYFTLLWPSHILVRRPATPKGPSGLVQLQCTCTYSDLHSKPDSTCLELIYQIFLWCFLAVPILCRLGRGSPKDPNCFLAHTN